MALSWYPWYWQDWRANRKVQRMTVTERGIYRELLDECWCEGSLPADMESLADVVRCSVEEMTAAWPALESSFFVRPDGRLVNPKIAIVLAAQNEAHERRVNAGRKGGLAPPKASPSNAKHKSRVETTLTTGQAALPSGASVPVSGKRISTPPFERAPDPLTDDFAGDAPTPEQVAELAAVRAALKGGHV